MKQNLTNTKEKKTDQETFNRERERGIHLENSIKLKSNIYFFLIFNSLDLVQVLQ